MRRRVAVFAGSQYEAVQYCERNHLSGLDTPGGPIYVHGLKALDGLRDFELHLCGTWYTRSDATEICDYAKFVGSPEIERK